MACRNPSPLSSSANKTCWLALSCERIIWAVPDHCSVNFTGYQWHRGSSSKKLLSLTKFSAQAHHLIYPLCWNTTSPLDNFVRPVLISSYNLSQKLNLALLHFTPLHPRFGMACQPMSGHHLPFWPSRKCSKLIISAALPPRSRASSCASDSFRLGPPGPCHYDLGVCFKSSLLLFIKSLLHQSKKKTAKQKSSQRITDHLSEIT